VAAVGVSVWLGVRFWHWNKIFWEGLIIIFL
jgi:hypothetical protein